MNFAGSVFLSYESSDGLDHARWIANQLASGEAPIQCWMADVDLSNTDDPIGEVSAAIQAFACFVLVETHDALKREARATNEWRLALKYKKAIIVAIIDDCELPAHLGRRERVSIDEKEPRDVEALRDAILKISTTEGRLTTAKHYLQDAEQARAYARLENRARIDADILELNRTIQSLTELLSNPIGVRERLNKRILLGVERERVPQSSSAAAAEVRYINAPPVPAPSHFQDRFVETRIMCDFLRDETKRLILVTGRGGVGKSALVCRLLYCLERGLLPDDNGNLPAAGIIYLSHVSQRRPTFDNLSEDLVLLLPQVARERLRLVMVSPQMTFGAKNRNLLLAFRDHSPSNPIVLLLDNMEDVINQSSFQFEDREIADFIFQATQTINSPIKIIITSRVVPQDFVRLGPTAQIYLPLDEGLASPYAENIFRALDAVGSLGLRDAPEPVLAQLREYTRGFPRAIEAVYMILTADRDTSIEDILKSPIQNDQIVRILVSEAFSRLDDSDQLLMQALAVFGQPMPVTAIEYVLRPWLPEVDAALSLKRLVHMLFVRKEGRHYYLHPIDRQHALRSLGNGLVTAPRVREVKSIGSTQDLTLDSLTRQAAGYFSDISLERSQWRSLDDIAPLLSEFRLRARLGDEWSCSNILDDLSNFLDKKGAFQLILTTALDLERISSSEGPRKIALEAKTKAYWRMGQIAEAVVSQRQLIELETDPESIALERCNLAIFTLRNGEYRAALAEFEGYLEIISQQRRANKNQPRLLHWIASCKEGLGYLGESIVFQEQALERASTGGDPDAIEAETHNLGSQIQEIGRIDEALTLYNDALKLSKENGNPLWKANHLKAIAGVQHLKGNLLEAQSLLAESMEIRASIGDFFGIVACLKEQANWLLLARENKIAEVKLREALRQLDDLGTREYGVELCLARVKASSAEWTEAERWARSSLELNTEGGTWLRRNLLAIAMLSQFKRDDSIRAFQQAHAEASVWLDRCPQNVDAWCGKGLAQAGLFVLGAADEAGVIEAYSKARAIVGFPSAILDRKWWLDILNGCHPSANLGNIMAAVDGSRRIADLVGSPRRGALAEPSVPSGSTVGAEMNTRDVEAVVEILAKSASGAATDPVSYFRDLIASADLPRKVKRKWTGAFSGDPEADARKLVNALSEFGTNPNDGNAAIGTLLLPTISFLGVEDATTLSTLLVGYSLVRSPEKLTELKSRFLIPGRPDERTESVERAGPNFHWSGPPDEVTLQGWFTPEPNYLDVALLKRAVDRARSVCRVELAGSQRCGTGVLVDQDLVLTNYHVISDYLADLELLANSTVLRFGAFTSEGASASKGREVLLDRQAPIVAASPADQHDFALLRTNGIVGGRNDIVSVQIVTIEPVPRSAIHILQHPSGGPMKLALSDNGVTSIDSASGKIQYVTRTAGGSSGSPCFDADWNFIAIHHAEVAKPFGSLREGILLKSIFDIIKPHLRLALE